MRLAVPRPYSLGIFLTYRCNSHCQHCMYACSSRWRSDWLSIDDAEAIFDQLAQGMRPRYRYSDRVGLNSGLHFTGGEPFLNRDLLLELVRLAARRRLPGLFVETNAFWCREDAQTRRQMLELKKGGLQGILISVNPFLLEYVPFERTDRAVRIAEEVFGHNAMIYQAYFLRQFRDLGIKGTLSFPEYLAQAGHGLRYAEILLNGRLPFKLGHLFARYPARHFFTVSCRGELLRDWHVHIDNYGNYVPAYCGGISLGDARQLDRLCAGIDLEKLPVVKALLGSLRELYDLGCRYGYVERADGYVSKCHLCADIRRHLAQAGSFVELQPVAFYDHLED